MGSTVKPSRSMYKLNFTSASALCWGREKFRQKAGRCLSYLPGIMGKPKVDLFHNIIIYLNLPNPTFLSVPIINPNMEFIGTRQKVGSGGLRQGLYYPKRLKVTYSTSRLKHLIRKPRKDRAQP